MRNTTIERPQSTSRLVNMRGVCQTLGKCRATVTRLDDLGEIPRSSRVGRCRMWVREHLEQWIAAGCPRLTGTPSAM